jgi:hypothetical protein
MSWTAEAVGATVDATSVAVDAVVEAHVRTVVTRNDLSRINLFKDFELCLRRFPDPLHGMG